MMDKSELAIVTSQTQNPIPFLIELLCNLLSQMITISTIKLTSQPVSELLFNLLSQMITISTIKLTSQPVIAGGITAFFSVTALFKLMNYIPITKAL